MIAKKKMKQLKKLKNKILIEYIMINFQSIIDYY